MSLTIILSVGFDPDLSGPRNVVLQSEGHVVISASSLNEAVSLFRGGDFDLVVLCHSMPEIDRNRFTCLIRASGSRTPVVSVSGKSCHCDPFADATLEDGPNKFLAGIQDVMRKQTRRATVSYLDQKDAPLPEADHSAASTNRRQ
jgi:CheY-like chemotaxis protein